MNFIGSRGSAVFLLAALLLAVAAARGAEPAAVRSERAGTGAAAPAAQTNAAVHFAVSEYEARGNTLLSEEELEAILGRHTGTNVDFAEVARARNDLQDAYRNRGYPTVRVTIPVGQELSTNRAAVNIVKFQVFEGRLVEVLVSKNRYFSSNNVRRALPGLHTNLILNSFVFQEELNRANENRDRTIYPELRPGPETNTSVLSLEVKDRLPLHGRVELNNQNTPGTPTLRINGTLVYNNLWQLEHSLGVQYGFSPEQFKVGNDWQPYDSPLVANYSAYYRMPLAGAEEVSSTVAAQPGTFGYNEGTRRFVLPPASGRPELNLFASRAAIDTALQYAAPKRLFTSATETIDLDEVHQDLTVNEDVGFRFSAPLTPTSSATHTNRHVLSAGLDLKSFAIRSFLTNDVVTTQYLTNDVGQPLPPLVGVTPQPVPPSSRRVEYLPIAARWDFDRRDRWGTTDFGMSLSENLWYSGSRTNFQNIVGSGKATGHWVSVGGSLARDQELYQDWRVTLRADGQWASEPLLSVEEYGLGGTAGVRGYHEGEVFGDSGWRAVVEPRSPVFKAGRIWDRYELTLRYSVFMDYGQTFLSDPQGRRARTPLWGIGAGVYAALGAHWEGRVAVGLPLISMPDEPAGSPRFYFALAALF